MMIAQRGVRFSDALPMPSAPLQSQWHVPSFATKVPPPPPQPAKVSIEGSKPTTPTSDATPKKSPPKIIHTGNENDKYFSTQSASTILSPISAITEVTEAGPSCSPSNMKRPVQQRMIGLERTMEEPGDEPLSNSFETLNTIDMLNFNFVHQCKSAKDLGKIIRLLADKSGSPQLLQTARLRLQLVQGKKAPPPPPRRPGPVKLVVSSKPLSIDVQQSAPMESEKDDEYDDNKSPGKIFTDSTANISRITLGNTTIDSLDASKNSLNLSYSPSSILRGLSLVETPNHSRSALYSESRYTRLGTISEISVSNQVTPQSDTEQERLSEEVKKLSLDAVEMESMRAEENSAFVMKLNALQSAKRKAETLVKTLESQVTVASVEKDDAIKAMEKIQQQQQAMREALQQERARLQERDAETRALEQRMQGKIAELQNAMQQEVERSNLVISAERSLRLKHESDLELQRERNVELNQLLRQTKENLERIKRTQDLFRAELLKAFGEKEDEFNTLPQTDFIAKMTGKVRDMKDENKRLNVALKEAQSAPNQIVEERNQLQQRIREALRANNVLQDDNVKLGSKIEELSSEVISSRALIDKLLKTSHDAQNSDWDKKEAQYRSVIRNYQQQIRKQASTVSLELYKAVVDDSKRTQTQLQDAEKKILDLQSKVTNLEKEGDTIVITKTPSNKRILMRNQLLSPTDFLEKGLLPEDYQQTQLRQSPHHDITLSAKKSRTPVSHLDINLADRMLSGRKEPDIRTRSPIEKMNLTRNDHMQSRENDRTPRPNERTIFIEEARARDDLTGMTICFQTPVTGISSPGEKTLLYPTDGSPFDMHINNWVDQYNQQNLHSAETKKGSQGATPMKSHHTTLGKHESLEHDIQSPSWNPTPLKRPVVRNFVDNDSTTPAAPPSASKENETFKTSPKSASKTLRMRKARELGGMKGMRSQLNKIRSPQSLGKPKRVAHVLGDRQLN